MVSDAELDSVYRGAQFTVFTSFTEGWGLPVGESLSRGVPCIASRAGAIPEVGGDLVDYVDPFDLDGGIAVFRRMIEDDIYRTARRRDIRERFRARTWRDVGSGVIGAIADWRSFGIRPRSIPAIVLSEGAFFDPGLTQASDVPIDGQFANPMSVALAASFYEPEPNGAWLRGGAGELTFQTSARPGEEIVIFLRISGAPWAGAGFSVSLATSRSPRRWLTVSAGGDNLIRLQGPTDADGICTIMFAYDGHLQTPPNDYRSLGVVLKAIGYARRSSADSRLALRERFLFAGAA